MKYRAADNSAKGRYETSPQTISASGRRRSRAAGPIAHRAGASLSDAARERDRYGSPWRWLRHHRATDGTMAVGAARPAVHHLEPPPRWGRYRDPGGGAGGPRWRHTPLLRTRKRRQYTPGRCWREL